MAGASSIALFRAYRTALILVMSMVVAAWVVSFSPGSSDDSMSASALQEVGAPVAEIYPMEEVVSNGTSYPLSAFGSHDTDNGTIVSYLWEIEHSNFTEYLYVVQHPYVFAEIGLYKITLTVTDDSGLKGVDFTAVYSVPDADRDGMADWWEVKYAGGITMNPYGDLDDDGYSNLEEYVHGTNPLVVDPPPSSEGIVEKHWELFLIAGIAVASVVIATYPIRRRRKKEAERKKMELAIEIQKALDEE